jgi:TonB family protein
MRIRILTALLLTTGIPLPGQSAPPAAVPSAVLPPLPKDPRAVLAAAAPFYNFDDPALKPWHLKATYQLYDESGKPTEQGTYEYWWASPQVHRSTWTRASATHTNWHLADGRQASLGTGQRLTYFEGELRNDLFEPVPSPAAIDPANLRLIKRELKIETQNLPCISLVPDKGREQGDLRSNPTYSFDASLPVLRLAYGFTGVVLTVYDRLIRLQGKLLARDVRVFAGGHTLFSATVDEVDAMNPADPVLVPPSDAIFKPDGISTSDDLGGQLVKRVMPEYPLPARRQRERGTVLIDAKISSEGKVEDPQVISSPSALLSDASLQAISQWQYKPYTLDGRPAEVDTLIPVIYSLGP